MIKNSNHVILTLKSIMFWNNIESKCMEFLGGLNVLVFASWYNENWTFISLRNGFGTDSRNAENLQNYWFRIALKFPIKFSEISKPPFLF